MKRLSTCVITALTVLCGCQHDVSGTYIASDEGSVVSVQIVRTPDNHLAGQFAVAQLKPDGTIDRKSANLSGAVDGENLSLTSAGLFGIQSMTLSGTLNGDTLTLTGPDAQPLIFKRSSLSVYQAQMNTLDGRSQAILAAKTAALSRQNSERESRNFVQSIDRLVEQMQQFDEQVDAHLAKFPGAEKRYQAISAKMRDFVEKERHLTGNPDASIVRSQLSIDATQVSYETDQLHVDEQSLESSVTASTNQLLTDARNYSQACQTLASTPQVNLTLEQKEVKTSACDRLRDGITLFRPKYNALEGGLTHLEQIYAQEKSTQQGLIETALKLR